MFKYKHWSKLIALPLLLLSPYQAKAQDYLDGQLNVTGFIRGNVALSLTHNNPSNKTIGGFGFDADDDQDLNLARILLVTDFDFRPRALQNGFFNSARFFARTRVNYDFTQDVSGGISDYNPHPESYRNDDTLMRVGGKQTAVEIWELFADFRKDNAWFRLGRQNIVWGEADAIRLLDVVNAIDATQQFFAGEGELFDHRRIPVWAARMTYDFASMPGNSIDAFVIPGDYVPTPSRDIGSPIRVNPLVDLPGFLAPFPTPPTCAIPPCPIPGLLLSDETDDRRSDWEGGIRWLGSIGGLQYSLNYISKIDQDGITVFNGIVPGLSPATGDIIRVNLLTKRERLDIFGASFNWFDERLGAVWRGEITHTPNQQYSNLAGTALKERATTRLVIGFDRPTFVFPTEQTMNISVQWFETLREDSDVLDATASPVDEHETNFSVLLSQPVNHAQLFYEFLAIIDTDDSYLWQPQIRYQPGDHWRLAVYANLFNGSETRPLRLGGLKFHDELNVSLTYQF